MRISADILKGKKLVKPLILLVVLLCLVGGAVYLFTHINRGKLIFSVDGSNYYQKSVQKLIKYPVTVTYLSQDKAAKEAFDELKTVKTAQKLGYKPSQTEINVQEQSLFSRLKISVAYQKQYSDWFTLSATAAAVNAHIGSSIQQGYAGYSYVFFFGQHLQAIPGYTITGLNDPKLVAQDQAYAKQRADYYYNQLKNNDIAPADALTKSISDMRSRGSGDNNPNFSVKFGSVEGGVWSNAVYFSPIIQYISGLHKTGVSTVQTGKATNKAGPGAKSVDMYYYFVYLTSAPPKNQSISTQAFNQALATLPAQYKGFK